MFNECVVSVKLRMVCLREIRGGVLFRYWEMGFVDVFFVFDKDMNGSFNKEELKEYVDGILIDIFIEWGMFCICWFLLLYLYEVFLI